MNEQLIKEIYALIPGAVLLPIVAGTKRPAIENWTAKTYEQTQTPEYQKQLVEAAAIGILLGKASGGSCSIDCDNEEAREQMLVLNPFLANTMQTRGRNGCNFWLIIKGNYPRLKKFPGWGEWRADGGMTIVAGAYKSSGEYRFINKVPPIEIDFKKIQWPKSFYFNNNSYSYQYNGGCIEEGGRESIQRNGISIQQSSSPSIQRKGLSIRWNEAKEKIYQEFIGQKIKPQQGNRNGALIAMLTFLFHASFLESVAMEFVTRFYTDNKAIFDDPLEQHLKEATAHWRNLEKDYPGKLAANELLIYDKLSPKGKCLFRACRDLAAKFGKFSLPNNHFGLRLGMRSIEVNRLIKKIFINGYGILEVVEPGHQHTVGKRGKATVYIYKLNRNENQQ